MRRHVTAPIAPGAPDPWIGRAVEGRYVVIEKIGTGATGHLYRAIQRSCGREVALKLPRPMGARHQGFAEEARLLDLAAPRAVALIEVGTTTGGGVPYLVTELVDGATLEETLRRGGALAARRAIRVALELCAFLDRAHQLSIVHRDLKPANVMLAPDGTGGDVVKVVDFGLARCDRRSTPGIEWPLPGLFGSPAYMAPEAITPERASPASDVYSLGCVLFEMLAGWPPFSGTVAEVLAQHRFRSRPELPAGLSLPVAVKALLGTLLYQEPLLRPTAAEAAAILARSDTGA